LPRVPEYWRATPTGVASRLGKTGVVDDHSERRKLCHHAPGQALPDRLDLPGALIDELLQALLVAVGQTGGHRLNRLASAVDHQAAQVDLAPQRRWSARAKG